MWLGVLPVNAAEVDVRRDATVKAIERVMPCVVNIGTKTRRERRGFLYDWFRDNWAPYTQELPPQESAGSGVIIDEEGYVLTNAHVVDGADEIWVKLHDNRIVQASLVTGTRKSDVALLRLRSRAGEKFPAAKFAEDDDLLLGETVVALGNPFGLGGSVSRGILSSKTRRDVPEGEEKLEVPDWLQTDAAINPGNSGGALINLRGELIGINVAVFRGGQGIGFAIPIKRVTEAIAELVTPEAIKQLWFGARLRPGVLPWRVTAIQTTSPADKAGLRPGDLLQRINDQTPKSFFAAMLDLVSAAERGAVTLQVLRGSEMKNISVQLVPEKTVFNAEMIQKKIGLSLQELTPAIAETLGFNAGAGLLIAGVDKSSAAATAGLQPRMLVRGMDGYATTEVLDIAKHLAKRKSGDRVKLDLIVPQQRGAFVFATPRTVELSVR